MVWEGLELSSLAIVARLIELNDDSAPPKELYEGQPTPVLHCCNSSSIFCILSSCSSIFLDFVLAYNRTYCLDNTDQLSENKMPVLLSFSQMDLDQNDNQVLTSDCNCCTTVLIWIILFQYFFTTNPMDVLLVECTAVTFLEAVAKTCSMNLAIACNNRTNLQNKNQRRDMGVTSPSRHLVWRTKFGEHALENLENKFPPSVENGEHDHPHPLETMEHTPANLPSNHSKVRLPYGTSHKTPLRHAHVFPLPKPHSAVQL